MVACFVTSGVAYFSILEIHNAGWASASERWNFGLVRVVARDSRATGRTEANDGFKIIIFSRRQIVKAFPVDSRGHERVTRGDPDG